MIRSNEHTICLRQGSAEIGDTFQHDPIIVQDRYMWVVIAHVRALLPQQMDNVQRWRLANIAYVSFVRHAQYQDITTFDRLSYIVERILDLLYPVTRHGCVDLAGQFDET